MKHAIIALTAASFLITACSTDPYTGEQKVSNTAIGAGTGALLGTAAGALLGATTNVKTRNAMLIGAGLGALAGGGVGLYMDNQEAKLRERLAGLRRIRHPQWRQYHSQHAIQHHLRH